MILWYNRGNDLMRRDASNIHRLTHKDELMSNLSIPQKHCSRCNQDFPATEEYFHWSNKAKGKFQSFCKPCYNARSKGFREKYAEKKKQYYQDKREYFLQRRKVYYYRNPEAKREYSRKYYQEHRIEQLKKQRIYVKRNPEIAKRHAKTRDNLRRARLRQLAANFTHQDYVRMMDYWDWSCCVCGQKSGLWHILAQEHWIAVADPRPDNPGTVASNMLPMCHAVKGSNGQSGCNNSKRAKDPTEWLTATYGKRKANQIIKRIQDYFEWVKSHDS